MSSKVSLRFAANISTMFTEIADFADRYAAAAAAGKLTSICWLLL